MAPEFTAGGIVGQTRVTNDYGFFNSLHIGKRVKMLLKSFKLWSSESATMKTFPLWFAVLPQKYAASTKSDQRQILHLFSLFVDRFSAVQLLNLVLFQNLHSLMSVGQICSGDRAYFPFLMAVTCSPSCIVTALALCRVSVLYLLTKNRTRNFLKVFWSWNWFCCLPTETVVCEQLSYTKCHIRIIFDNAFTFNCSSCCCETFVLNQANPNFLHRWEYIRERYQTVFNCKLRAPQVFDDRTCQEAKSSRLYFSGCFTLRFSQFLKRLRAFLSACAYMYI